MWRWKYDKMQSGCPLCILSYFHFLGLHDYEDSTFMKRRISVVDE